MYRLCKLLTYNNMDDIVTLQAKYGITPKPAHAEVNTNRLSKLDAAWGPKSEVTQDQGSFYGGGENSIGSKLIKDVQEGSADFTGDGSVKSLLGPTKAVFRGGGDVLGAVAHPIGVAIDTLTGGKFSEGLNKLANTAPSKGSLIDKLTDVPIFQELAKNVSNEDFGRFMNWITGAMMANEKLPSGEKPGVETIIERTKPQIEAIKNSPETVINKADEFKTKVADTVTNVKNKVTGTVDSVMTPKQPEVIKNTPESEVYKLNPKEREAYWKNKSTEMTSEMDTEMTKLKSEVDKVSVEESGNLKKPVTELYKKQSQQFQKLFEEDFTPEKQSVPLKQGDIISKLDEEFANNPEMNPKTKWGLDETGSDITAKDLYDKVRAMKTSAPGSKGTSTFTANDLAINQTRGVLTDILKENGVDLSKANEFWSKWKPLQREITSKIKPFEPGYKTGTMAEILKKQASEVGDAKNAKFISDLEEHLGEKIGGETRTAVEKLSALEKKALADKIALTEKKFSSEQFADLKAWHKKVFWYAVGALGIGSGVVGGVKHLLP